MTSEYPNIVWAMSGNSTLSARLCQDLGDRPEYLSSLEELFQELRSHGVPNIAQRLKEVDDLFKLSAVRSELEFARRLLSGGKRVELLSGDRRAPGILWEQDGLTGYVDTVRPANNELVFNTMEYLRGFLAGKPYRVDVKFNHELSLPALSYQDRKRQLDLLDASIEEFARAFEGLTDLPASVRTDGAAFEVVRTKTGHGYPGLIDAWPIEVPEKTLGADIGRRLVERARKRKGWVKERPEYPYIVAIDGTEWSLEKGAMDRFLYGDRVKVESLDDNAFREKQWRSIVDNKEAVIPRWADIDSAGKAGWKAMLMEKGLIPMGYEYLVKEGLFLSEREMKNVTGVLWKAHGDIRYFPNPFASREINHPGLMM